MRCFKLLLLTTTVFSSLAVAEAELTPDMKVAVKANNEFAWKFWQEVQKDLPEDSNILVSGFSLYTALSLASNGAAQQTLGELRQTLGQKIPGVTEDVINRTLKELVADLLTGEKTDEKISTANAMWANADKYRFKADFVKIADEYFNPLETDSIARSESFADPKTLENINGWVKASTGGMIPSILEELDPSFVAILLNALFFEGQWEKSFEKQRTQDATFTTESGGEHTAKMMARNDNQMAYAEDDKFKLVTLQFRRKTLAEGEEDQGSEPGRFAVDLILAKSGSVRSLDEKSYGALVRKAQRSDVQLQVPKFKFDYTKVLNETLATLGIKRAFGLNGPAQFDRLGQTADGDADVPVQIDIVLQKTAVEMSEGGFKAAAVTAIAFERTGRVRPESEKSFIADKPFFITLRDTRTGTILFQGIVNKPEWNG